jgi:hypothetical protein
MRKRETSGARALVHTVVQTQKTPVHVAYLTGCREEGHSAGVDCDCRGQDSVSDVPCPDVPHRLHWNRLGWRKEDRDSSLLLDASRRRDSGVSQPLHARHDVPGYESPTARRRT